MSEKLYTQDEIKLAFWKRFHMAGEMFFPYVQHGRNVTEEVCTETTEFEWKEFLECLNEKS